MINCSAVIIDPVIYIIYHQKYRKAITQLLYSCAGGRSKLERTGLVEQMTNTSSTPVRQGSNRTRKVSRDSGRKRKASY